MDHASQPDQSIVLLVPDGVGVRNFVLGPFLERAGQTAQCYLLHQIPAELRQTYEPQLGDHVLGEQFQQHRESAPAALLRYSLAYAQMYWAGTRAMTHNLRRPITGSWRHRALHHLARAIGRAAASPRGLRLLDRRHAAAVRRLPAFMHYKRLFARLRPSVLICTHQRPPSVVPAVLAAQELDIPTATFIFSWDNLTSKGRIAAPFDHYLVWSDLMKSDLLRYYPDVAPERVHVVGTPQFDPYADRSLLWTREEFCRRIGADPRRQLICYSGGDEGTCPEDPEHLRILLEQIRDGAIKGSPQVLLRPAPVDDGRRYQAVRHDHPELLVAQPAWAHPAGADWSQITPLPEDIEFLANLTQHADLNVNLASTMTLDFAIHDRPVVNVAFDVASPPPHGLPLWDYYYQFEHYRPVVELGAARFARSPQELAAHVNSYLADPALDRDNRRRLVELQVGAPIGAASERIMAAVERIAKARHAHLLSV